MGSVSSLVSGHSLHSKHCQATEYKLKKAGHHRKTGRSLDGLLKYSFAQGSSNNTSKAISHSGRSEDFFYIKVSHKPRTTHQRGILTENLLGQGHFTDTEPDCRVPTMSGKLEKVSLWLPQHTCSTYLPVSIFLCCTIDSQGGNFKHNFKIRQAQ